MLWGVAFFVALMLYFSSRYRWWGKTIDYKKPRILMYHMVREHVAGGKFNGLRVTPALFEQQLRWLVRHGWTFYTMAELMRLGSECPEKSVVLTFDDGYADNFTQVLPLLEKYQAKATIYLVCDRHERDWSVYKKKHHASGELMREPKLTDEQVRLLIDSGRVEIASHTLTHLNLQAATHEQAEVEITASRTMLEQRFNIEVTSFAYPFGIFTARDEKLVEKAGYNSAVTTEDGCTDVSKRFALARVKVSGKEGMYAFALRMRTGKRKG